MRIGKLRHRVTIQKPARVQDPDTGSITEGWADVATVWAGKRPVSAKEFMSAQAMQSEIVGEFRIRYRDDIDATMRIVYRGKKFNIEGAIPDHLSGVEWLTLPYSEGVSDGR